MIHFISDTHFFSENIIDYCNRPFTSAEVMNEEMIRRWNLIVQPEDEVYHLGDFVMHDASNIPKVVPLLNGKIHLIRGNHDTRAKLEVLRTMPNIADIQDIAYIQHKGLFFVACHFPMTNEDFLKMVIQDNSEVVVIHGHVHDKVPFFTEETHSFNVSADVTGFAPIPITTIYRNVKAHFIEKGVWTSNANS